jgi:hypothetical protein
VYSCFSAIGSAPRPLIPATPATAAAADSDDETPMHAGPARVFSFGASASPVHAEAAVELSAIGVIEAEPEAVNTDSEAVPEAGQQALVETSPVESESADVAICTPAKTPQVQESFEQVVSVYSTLETKVED